MKTLLMFLAICSYANAARLPGNSDYSKLLINAQFHGTDLKDLTEASDSVVSCEYVDNYE